MIRQTAEEAAGALVRRGAKEQSAGHVENALATFSEVVSRFGTHTDPAVLIHVADALENKARLLAGAGRSAEAIETADAYVRRFGLTDDLTPRIRSQLGSVMQLKAILLVPVERSVAREIVDQVVRLCASDPEPLVRATAEETLDRYARVLTEVGDLNAAAAAFGEIPAHFQGDDELAAEVARGMFNRGIALRDAGRLTESALALDALVRRFDGRDEPELRRAVVGGLYNKAVVLAAGADITGALDTYDTVIVRFTGDDDPQVVDWVRRSTRNAGQVRLGPSRLAGRIVVGRPEDVPLSAADEARIGELIEQMHRLAAEGDAELALELGTRRRRELADRGIAPHISLLELDGNRGFLQLATGDASIAEVTLVETWVSASRRWRLTETLLAHWAECLGVWHLTVTGDHNQALGFLGSALRLRANGPEEADAYSRTLARLGAAIQRAGPVEPTRTRLQRHIEELGDPAETAGVSDRPSQLALLAELLRREGRSAEAEAAADRAVRDATRWHGASGPIVAAARSLRSAAAGSGTWPPPLDDAGLLRHAASSGLRILGDVPGVADHVSKLYELETQDSTGEALALADRIRLATAGGMSDPAVIALELATGWLRQAAGEDAADRRLGETLTAANNAWARAERLVAETGSTLGQLYQRVGDSEAAVEFQRAALDRCAARDEDGYLFARILASLAVAYAARNDGDQASRLMDGALRRVNSMPQLADTVERSEMLTLYADLQLRRNDPEGAEQAARKAVEIAEKARPGNYGVLAGAQLVLAAALRALDRLADAVRSARQAQASLARADPHGEMTARTSIELAAMLAEAGEIGEAAGLLDAGSRVADARLLLDLELVPPDERLALMLATRSRLDLWLTLAYREGTRFPALVTGGFDALERRRASDANADMAVRDEEARTPEWREQRHELRELRLRAADLMLSDPDEDGYESLSREISSLETQVSLGRRIGMLTPAVTAPARRHDRFGDWMNPSAHVGGFLAPDCALISYARFRELSLGRAGSPDDEPQRYLAFLQRGGGGPMTVIDLGTASHIDALVRDFLHAIATDGDFLLSGGVLDPVGSATAVAGRSLRAAVVDPFAGALSGARRLLVIPDGTLGGVPFQTLSDDLDGFLIDRYEITYLAGFHELLHGTPSSRPAAGPSAVFADPDYNLGSEDVDAAVRGGPFPRLTWTAEEGRQVGSILGVGPVLGQAATQAEFLATENPRILHVATHGWYLPYGESEDDEPEWTSHPRLRHMAGMAVFARPGVVVQGLDTRVSAQLYGQLLARCGLVTAGFNTAWAGGSLPAAAGDGLVTAAEVAALELRGTELVVLSACETGLGAVMDFQGAYGLRRAFAAAGAQAIIAALWQVSDETTVVLMNELYQRLVAGAGRSQGLRDAQLAVRRSQAHPYFWGAFVCQGDSGPLSPSYALPGSQPGEQATASSGSAPRRAGSPATVALASRADGHFWRGEVGMADQLWREAADGGDPRSAHNIAVGLHEAGLPGEAEARYRQAAEALLPEAAGNLGQLLWQQGDLDGATERLRQAVDLGHEPAAFTLGCLLQLRGDGEGAERVWRRAASNDTAAAFRLAELLLGHGDSAEAAIWWRRAAERGLAIAAWRLGSALCEEYPTEEGEKWLRQAAEAGIPEAGQSLAAVARYRETEAALLPEREAAAEAGDAQAAVDLGIVAQRHDDEAGALRWWRIAASRGHEQAALVLARLLAARGEDAEAEALVRPLADGGDAVAAHVLGAILRSRGALEEAERWLRRAIEAGQNGARDDLGEIMWQRGSRDEAERLWHAAAENGSGEAARSLAACLEETGREGEAARWWRVAATAGVPGGAHGLGCALSREGEVAEAERWLRRAAAAGEKRAMADLASLLTARHDPEAEEWLRLAHEDMGS